MWDYVYMHVCLHAGKDASMTWYENGWMDGWMDSCETS